MKSDDVDIVGHMGAAQGLAEGDRRWRHVFEHIPSICFVIDPHCSLLALNSCAASLLGLAATKLVGRSLLDRLLEDDKELVQASIAACLDLFGPSTSWEAAYVREDGTVRRLRQSAKAVRCPDGQTIVLISGHEITESHHDELVSSRLAAVVSSSDDAIIGKTLDGTVTAWNLGATAIFGYQADEMIGQSITRIIPAELQDEERRILERLRRGRRVRHYETTRTAKDGRRVEVSLTISPVFNKAGKVVGVSKVARDITEPKSAAQALREGTASLRALIDTAVDGVILIDARGTVLVFNPACEKLFGYAADAVIGKNVNMLMPEPYRHQHDSYISNYHTTREAKIIGIGREVVGRRKDGSTFPMKLSVGEAQQDGGSIFVGIIHDLSASKRTQAELQQARHELAHVARVTTLGELTAAIAHEVNQPLTGLVSSGNACLRWLAGDPPNLEAARQSVQRMIGAGNRAGETIARIRALVAKSPPRREQVNVADTIMEAIALVQVEIERHRIVLLTDLAHGLPRVRGDRIQLQQVLLNLVLNAVEAMGETSESQRVLSISAAKEGSNRVCVAVRDSGIGLDSNDLTQLFEAFYTTKPQGMGIGLPVSRTIIEAHGGQLWATPNQPMGAVFQFILPIDEEQAS